MKIGMIALVSALVLGCSSGSGSSPEPGIDGTWLYIDAAGDAGFGATLRGDRFVLMALRLTSSTTANAEVEVGTFTDDGKRLTFSTEQSTCSSDTSAPVTYSYALDGDSLYVGLPQGEIGMQRDTAQASNDFIITNGCFLTDGKFVPAPLSNVR